MNDDNMFEKVSSDEGLDLEAFWASLTPDELAAAEAAAAEALARQMREDENDELPPWAR